MTRPRTCDRCEFLRLIHARTVTGLRFDDARQMWLSRLTFYRNRVRTEDIGFSCRVDECPIHGFVRRTFLRDRFRHIKRSASICVRCIDRLREPEFAINGPSPRIVLLYFKCKFAAPYPRRFVLYCIQ